MTAVGVHRGAVGMDILHLIERLETLAVTSPRVPITGKAMIEPQEILDLVDEMRIALPESVHEAQRLLEERAGSRIRQEPLITAPPEVRVKLEGHDLVKLAEQRAREIVTQAEREAEGVLEAAQRTAESLRAEAEAQRQGADTYAREVLSKLEGQLGGMLATVRRGLEVLEEEQSTKPQP